MPNIAISVPAGNGGSMGAPFTTCLGTTGIFSARPGRASLGEGSLVPEAMVAKHETEPGVWLGAPARVAALVLARLEGGAPLRVRLVRGERRRGRVVSHAVVGQGLDLVEGG